MSRRWRPAASRADRQAQPLAAVVEALRRSAEQILRVGEAAGERRHLQPPLAEQARQTGGEP